MIKKSGCYSFKCLRRFLTMFNLILFALGLLIATLPIYFQIHKMVKSWPINGGIIGMGSFLVLIALIGCYGSNRQNQIILFFYMVVLSLVCILTFAFSLAALSLTRSQQNNVLAKSWETLSSNSKSDIQKFGNCCGFHKNSSSSDHPSCEKLTCFSSSNGCKPCEKVMEEDWFLGFRRTIGGFSLFVSILMCISIYFTSKYRHIKNPASDPNEYL